MGIGDGELGFTEREEGERTCVCVCFRNVCEFLSRLKFLHSSLLPTTRTPKRRGDPMPRAIPITLTCSLTTSFPSPFCPFTLFHCKQ